MSEYRDLIDEVYDGTWDRDYNKTLRVKRSDIPSFKYRRTRRDLCRYIDSLHVLVATITRGEAAGRNENELHEIVRATTGIDVFEFGHLIDDLHDIGLLSDDVEGQR